MLYHAPKVAQMKEWKDRLRLSATQMARITGLKSGRRWREYADENKPQGMPPANLFMGAAMSVLPSAEIELVLAEMRRIGATIDLDAPTDSPVHDGDPQL